MNKAIEFRSVHKKYPYFHLQDVCLDVQEGSVMGLVGPSGSGKSTILRMIMGLVSPDQGCVEVLGRKMPQNEVWVKNNIGFVSEDLRLYDTETIAFHMSLIESIYPTWDKNYASYLLKRFDLEPQQIIKGLSHGQRVKVALLLALSKHPKLLVLDEPTTGLDPAARLELLSEMNLAAKEEGNSIIFSSHNTLDVEKMSDHITFIFKGGVLDSKEKDAYMNSWRRIKFSTTIDTSMYGFLNIKEESNQKGNSSIVINNFDQCANQIQTTVKGKIESTEKLTLEEIFLCNVQCEGSLC